MIGPAATTATDPSDALFSTRAMTNQIAASGMARYQNTAKPTPPEDGGGDREAVDRVCGPGEGGAGDEYIAEPGGQAPRDLKDLGLGVARRQVGLILEPRAAAARVRRNDDETGAGGAQLLDPDPRVS